MTFMLRPDAEFLKQAIKDQIAPLIKRIEALEAELKNSSPPCHGTDDAFCMVCNPPIPSPNQETGK